MNLYNEIRDDKCETMCDLDHLLRCSYFNEHDAIDDLKYAVIISMINNDYKTALLITNFLNDGDY